MPRSSLRAAFVLFALFVALPGGAILPPERSGGGHGTELRWPPFVLQETSDAALSVAMANADPAVAAFRDATGGTWHVRMDRRTARPAMIWGSGMAWLPGRGNDLTWKDVTGNSATPAPAAVLSLLEDRARQFMRENADLFDLGPDGERGFHLDPRRSGSLLDRKVWYLTFAPAPGGVPVERASVFFRLNSGNVIQFGTLLVADELWSSPTAAQVTAADAMVAARLELASYLGLPVSPDGPELDVEVVLNPGTLALVPWADDARRYEGEPGHGLRYELVWKVGVRLAGSIESWTAQVDATSGTVLTLYDDNKYQCAPQAMPQGRVTGGVYLGPIEQVPETVRGFPFTAVTNGPGLTTDYNGLFPYTPGNPASTGLNGQFFDMECDQCNNPAQASVTNAFGGALALGTGGDDFTGNGFSTPAERNCFYHLNVVRQIADKHLDDPNVNGYFTNTLPATVNVGFACNAVYAGPAGTFFARRSVANGCNNTGEIADVMQHEWGHGLDQFTGGGGDGSRGEGMSDVVAFLATHDERLGPYFFIGDPNGIRHADEAVAPEGVLTLSNTTTQCFVCGPCTNGPGGSEIHCEGQILSQAWWHLARNLRDKATAAGGNDDAGWYATERLFFGSRPLTDTFIPDQAGSEYDGAIAIDDDNGNLADGTPNGAEIANAFLHHEIASTPQAGDSVDCVPPAAPAITLTPQVNPMTGLWQVDVTWAAVPGALEYRISRNDAGGNGADVEIGTVFAPATTILDDNVTAGVNYFYRVRVFDGSGCASIVDNQQSTLVAPIADLNLVVDSFTVDDSTTGNANGVGEPGETFLLSVALTNAGQVDATNVVGTLSTSWPGVTIVDDMADFGDLMAGMSGGSVAPHFTVQVDPTVACGDQVLFDLALDGDQGCSAAASLVVPMGQFIGGSWQCDSVEARPRLAVATFVLGDDVSFGGAAMGNGDGMANGAETLRIPVDLTNGGNELATNVRATATLATGPAGTVLSDTTAEWPDVAVGNTERSAGAAPAHFEVEIPSNPPCRSPVRLDVVIDYDGPSGSYTENAELAFVVDEDNIQVVFFDDYEGGDNGWTHGTDCAGGGCDPQDDWQHLAPAATSPFDTDTTVSGQLVWGNDLGQTIMGQPWNGNYRPDVDNWLESPSFDCSGLTGVTIRFWRWLSVEQAPFDRARVVVNGTEIWSNPAGADLLDTAWTYQEFDISAIADGNPDVRVRFTLTADGGLQYGGWTLDDFELIACASSCSAPAVPGPSGTTLFATGNYDEDGAEFEWAGAPLPQPDDSYSLYRGTVPDTLTDLLTPAAFTGTTFDDRSASGPLYFYKMVYTNCAGVDGPFVP